MNAWCGGDLKTETGWTCIFVTVFKEREKGPKPYNPRICGKCDKFVIIGPDGFQDNISEITKDLNPPSNRKVAKCGLNFYFEFF